MTNVKMPRPIGYFECDPETLKPIWGEECICQDNVYDQDETGTVGRAIIFADQAQAYADERVREAQQWVSVDDRLPEWAARDDTPCIVNGKTVPPTLTSKTVLVALTGGGVYTDKLTAIEGSGPPWWDHYGRRVIAWMPLPPPPKQSTPA